MDRINAQLDEICREHGYLQPEVNFEIRNGEHHYIFVVAREYIADAKLKAGQWASNPELNFTWGDVTQALVELDRGITRPA